jgi:hypothetical protein
MALDNPQKASFYLLLLAALSRIAIIYQFLYEDILPLLVFGVNQKNRQI